MPKKSSNSDDKYSTIKLPKALLQQIKNVMGTMYSNHTDFIKETLRNKLSELKNEKK